MSPARSSAPAGPAPAPAPLPADLETALKRLKLATVRRLGPEVLATPKVQRPRGGPAHPGRGRDRRPRRGQPTAPPPRRRFPVVKNLEEFQVAASSVPQATFDHLASLEWIRAKANLCLVNPAGTGKSHLLVALGHAAIDAGLRVRYLTAADLVEHLYRGLADNSVGRVIDTLLRHELIIVDGIGFAALDDTGTQLLFRFVAAAYERRSLGIASHWPFESWGRFLPEHVTASSLLDRLLHHATVVVTDGESYRMREARPRSTASRP